MDKDPITATNDNNMCAQMPLLETSQISKLNINDLNFDSITIDTSHNSYGNALQTAIYSVSNPNGLNFNYPSFDKSLSVKGNAEFEGDVKIQGHSILHLLKKIEDRLAVLQEPDSDKLEKFASLKKAYDHYKTLERLIGNN
jgi:hypothetical protein